VNASEESTATQEVAVAQATAVRASAAMLKGADQEAAL
jgi:hypothetical protein